MKEIGAILKTFLDKFVSDPLRTALFICLVAVGALLYYVITESKSEKEYWRTLNEVKTERLSQCDIQQGYYTAIKELQTAK